MNLLCKMKKIASQSISYVHKVVFVEGNVAQHHIIKTLWEA